AVLTTQPGTTYDFALTRPNGNGIMVVPTGTNSASFFGNVGVGTGNNSLTATLQVAGTSLFKNTADSTTAFQIQNAAASSLFVADTTNSRIQIGSATADDTGVLLVLDTKTGISDPVGINGAMYYNSGLGRFRCYQNGAWKDCITSVPSSITFMAMDKAGETWFNMPASLAEFDDDVRQRTKADLTGATQIRFLVNLGTDSGSSAAKLRLQYSTDQTTWSYMDSGTGPEVAIGGTVSNTLQVSPWATLASGAKADVFLRVVGIDGNGSADPIFVRLEAQLR
ncbi:MAG TPA: hypothetical protein VK963_02340, partial [Candidatus Saccharimonadales bacterium]|nr:hypothetical protein [Candidatus Saccharimonadales bacterium]